MDPFLGEIRLVGYNFAPVGWLLCQGQVLNIGEYDALFALLGTTFGGDGVQTFALPDFRGRAPVHAGTTASGSYLQGQVGGAEQVTLNAAQVGSHIHSVAANNAAQGTSSKTSPEGLVFGTASTIDVYESTAANGVSAPMLSAAGMPPAMAHENRMPFLAMNYMIATNGVYPSQQ